MKRRDFLQGLGALTLASAAPVTSVQATTLPATLTMTGVDNSGAVFSLDRFVNKVCLVSFFSAGCTLCSRDLKQMREFHLSNKSKAFALIGVNLDASQQDFANYMKLIGLTVPAEQRFPVLWRAAPDHHDNFGAIVREPTHFVLDAQHRLSFRRDGTFQPDDWDRLWTTISV